MDELDSEEIDVREIKENEIRLFVKHPLSSEGYEELEDKLKQFLLKNGIKANVIDGKTGNEISARPEDFFTALQRGMADVEEKVCNSCGSGNWIGTDECSVCGQSGFTDMG